MVGLLALEARGCRFESYLSDKNKEALTKQGGIFKKVVSSSLHTRMQNFLLFKLFHSEPHCPFVMSNFSLHLKKAVKLFIQISISLYTKHVGEIMMKLKKLTLVCSSSSST